MKAQSKSISLFNRIGGMPAVGTAVDIFYSKVIKDETVNYYFAHIDMTTQKHKLKAFLAYAFGAPLQYSGKGMQEAHAHMDISDTQFNAVAWHLVHTLQDLEVAQTEIDEVVAIAMSVKDDIVKS